MIGKLLRQILVSALLFLSVFYILLQVDWVSIVPIDRARVERYLGKLVWLSYSSQYREIENKDVVAPVDDLLTRLCETNGLVRDSIKLRVVRASEENAFAGPDRYIVVHSALISNSVDEEELAGVLAHELAHIQKNHVWSTVKKELGLSLFFITMSGNGEQLAELTKILASSFYSREQETEADCTSVAYLCNAGINPEGMVRFMQRMSEDGDGYVPEWMSTHPNWEHRIATLRMAMKECEMKEKSSVISTEAWERMKRCLGKNVSASKSTGKDN